MQRSPIMASLLSAFAITAHAQSSVTLYGSLDAGLVYWNNQGGHSNWQQGSGSLSNTCFDPRGSEEGERLQRLGRAEVAHRVAARRFPRPR
ncbi:putative porin [Paraburkholderia sp. JPY419]